MKEENKDLIPAGIAGNDEIADRTRNLKFIVEPRGPAKFGNKQAQIVLDMMSTLWTKDKNLLRFFGVTIVADKDTSLPDSWLGLESKIDTLESIVRGLDKIQIILWGVECHRKGKAKRDNPVNSTLLGKPHIHAVVGIGSDAGVPILDRELRYIFLRHFNDVTVRSLKKYKDICTFMGYTLKEYQMADVKHNLEQVDINDRYGLIVRSRWLSPGVMEAITTLERFIAVEIKVVQLDDTTLFHETNNKKLLLTSSVIDYLAKNKMIIDAEGGYFELVEGASTCYRKRGQLKDLILDVSKEKGLEEAVLSDMKGLNGLVQHTFQKEGREWPKVLTSVELKDAVIDMTTGTVLLKQEAFNKGLVSLGYIDRKLGDIRTPIEFIKYLELSGVPKEQYLGALYNISQGLRYEGKALYIHGPGGTGKSMIFRDLLKIVLGSGSFAIIKPNDLSRPFGLEPLAGKRVAVLEEFQATALSSKVRETTLLFLENTPVVIDRKYNTSIYTECNMSLVLISNFSLKDLQDHMEWSNLGPFIRRVLDIEVKKVEGLEVMYPLILETAFECILHALFVVKGIRTSKGKHLTYGEVFGDEEPG